MTPYGESAFPLMTFFWVALVVQALICAFGASAIAGSKGRGSGGWFLLGLLCGPLGLLITGFMEKETVDRRTESTSELGDDRSRLHCPDCAELIRKEAKVCHFCGRQMIYPKAPATEIGLPPSAEAKLHEAHRILSSGNPKGALDAYQAITREYPDFTDAWRCISTLAYADQETKDDARRQVVRLSQSA